jgi:hypothetical protein
MAGGDQVLLVFRAYRTFAFDEEGEAEIRHRLGCDPCRRIERRSSQGSPAVYLFDPEAPLALTRADAKSASIGEAHRDGGVLHLLSINLSSSGRERFASYAAGHDDAMAVSMLGDEILGVAPLFLAHDQFGLGSFSSQAEAEAVARRLGVPYQAQ